MSWPDLHCLGLQPKLTHLEHPVVLVCSKTPVEPLPSWDLHFLTCHLLRSVTGPEKSRPRLKVAIGDLGPSSQTARTSQVFA